MTHLIIHRGIGGKNTLMGILTALFIFPTCAGKWCEVDLLWDGSQWWLCHDFDTFRSQVHGLSRFTELLSVLTTSRLCHKPANLLLDVKWDAIYNRSHDWRTAWASLDSHLSGVSHPHTVWIQLNHTLCAKTIPHPYRYPVGLAVHAPPFPWGGVGTNDLTGISRFLFFTINLSAFSDDDIRCLINGLQHPVHLFGYTCPSIEHRAPFLAKLAHALRENDAVLLSTGLVCDVPL